LLDDVVSTLVLLVLFDFEPHNAERRTMWQVTGSTATVKFQFATKPMSASAHSGFLSCLLPHHVEAGASGKVVLKVKPGQA
jgi:hypothetical protein